MGVNIKTVNDLQAFADGADARLCDMKERMVGVEKMAQTVHNIDHAVTGLKRLVLAGSKLPDESGRANAERFGDILKGIGRGNREALNQYGCKLVDESGLDRKADYGTPLVGSSTTGSYLIPEQLANWVARVTPDESEIIPRLREWPVTTRTAAYPESSTELTFYKISGGDTGDVTENLPSFGDNTINVQQFCLYFGISEALAEDSSVNVGSYFGDLVKAAYINCVENQVFNGTSDPTGLLVHGSIPTVTMAGRSFEDVSVNDLVNMRKELAGVNGALRGAAFCMSPWQWEIVKGLVDDSGRPLLQPWQDAVQKQILGLPVYTSFQMPGEADDAASTKFIVLGNLKHMIHATRIGMDFRLFDQTVYAVANCEWFYRGRFRSGFDCARPDAFVTLRTAA